MEYANANANANAVMISEHEPHPDESYLYDLNIDEDNDAHLDNHDDYQFNNKLNMNMFNETSFCSGHHPTDVGIRELRTPLSKRFQSPMASNNRMRLQKPNNNQH